MFEQNWPRKLTEFVRSNLKNDRKNSTFALGKDRVGNKKACS